MLLLFTCFGIPSLVLFKTNTLFKRIHYQYIKKSLIIFYFLDKSISIFFLKKFSFICFCQYLYKRMTTLTINLFLPYSVDSLIVVWPSNKWGSPLKLICGATFFKDLYAAILIYYVIFDYKFYAILIIII